MRVLLLGVLMLFSAAAFSQSCPSGQVFNSCDGPQFGPGPCTPGCVSVTTPVEPTEPTGAELCLPEGCSPVVYSQQNGFAIAQSHLPNGYPIVGWSGPCLESECPDLLNQAFTDLELNAKRANRAQRFE